MNLWAIYDNPTDFPAGTFVARKFELDTPTLEIITGKSLHEVRMALRKSHPGLYWFPRYPHDDPKIVEVWI